VVRDLPERQFLILGGTTLIWEQFHNARAVTDNDLDSSMAWNPLTPYLTRSTGQDVFQIAADRFREAGITVDRGPGVCHLPVSPLPGRKEPSGVLLDFSGTEGTTGMIPERVLSTIETNLWLSAIHVRRLTGPFDFGTALEAILEAKVVVCAHGPVHLMSCGAHFPLEQEPARKTVLLAGGAWPPWAVPGRRQIIEESWHKVSCSNGGCGAFLSGPGNASTDRCSNCQSGYPECLEQLDSKAIEDKIRGLLEN
jgi:hypothetical protein